MRTDTPSGWIEVESTPTGALISRGDNKTGLHTAIAVPWADVVVLRNLLIGAVEKHLQDTDERCPACRCPVGHGPIHRRCACDAP